MNEADRIRGRVAALKRDLAAIENGTVDVLPGEIIKIPPCGSEVINVHMDSIRRIEFEAAVIASF